ncbi:macrophage mannose receptor 1 [Elysia marginata]|uniref:Macrophage mannose receptor 1 n=1 Tax=Elysia marginata TaxID=1093978 RepID=A0AAV4GPW4_9GAST|nr:macrophage mannose receptor 1 [Elysia marginata]
MVGFTNWDSLEPKEHTGNQDSCVTVNSSSGFWSSTGCSSKRGRVCEEVKVALCEDGWIPSSHSQTCVMVFGQPAHWTVARKTCREHGGELVMILNKDTNRFLADQIMSLEDGVWIGFNDRLTEGSFKWLDYVEDYEFTIWADHEPAIAEDKDCVFLHKTITGNETTGYAWSVENCTKKLGFICESFPGCHLEKNGMICPKTCSAHCKGKENSCNRRTGVCSFGCEIGFHGDTCETGKTVIPNLRGQP